MDLATIRSGAQSRLSQTMQEAFPDVDWLIDPLGNQVIVQLRISKRRTAGGLVLPGETRDFDRSVVRVGKVVAIGPLAYKKRDSMENWPEGAWVKLGDFVRVPSYAGVDSWRVLVGTADREKNGEDEFVLFACFNDYDLKGRIKGDPLAVVDYV